MNLTNESLKALDQARVNGICEDTEQEIIDIVLEQEIVSYCTSKGCVSFDVHDVVFEG